MSKDFVHGARYDESGNHWKDEDGSDADLGTSGLVVTCTDETLGGCGIEITVGIALSAESHFMSWSDAAKLCEWIIRNEPPR